MPDIECDVCLSPELPAITAEFTMTGGPAQTTIRFCEACTEALFDFLNKRYWAAIADHNAAVEWLLDGLGIESPWSSSDD